MNFNNFEKPAVKPVEVKPETNVEKIEIPESVKLCITQELSKMATDIEKADTFIKKYEQNKERRDGPTNQTTSLGLSAAGVGIIGGTAIFGSMYAYMNSFDVASQNHTAWSTDMIMEAIKSVNVAGIEIGGAVLAAAAAAFLVEKAVDYIRYKKALSDRSEKVRLMLSGQSVEGLA